LPIIPGEGCVDGLLGEVCAGNGLTGACVGLPPPDRLGSGDGEYEDPLRIVEELVVVVAVAAAAVTTIFV